MRKLFFILLLTVQVSAQEYAVKKGIVTDSLKISDSINESFALYLPMDYQKGKKWPLILIFDPEGRGKTAAQLFRNTAEQQGYIVASSNNISSEKDLIENVKTAVRLANTVTGTFPIDPRQISTAGSMDGGKVASSMPLLNPDIHGVIAVGNHWINFDRLDKTNNFTFIGMVGDEHFTSESMKMTAEVLQSMKFPSQVYTYEGNGEWPEPQMINSAVASLTLEAMRGGFRPQDPELIKKFFEQDLSRANELISKVKLVEALSFLRLLEEKYSGLHSIEPIEEKIRQLERSRNYREQEQELSAVLEKEKRLLNDFVYYLEEDIQTENFENLGWWNFQKKELDSLSAKGGAEGKMARRLQSLISALSQAYHEDLEEKHASLEKKLLANMILTIFDPQNFNAYKKIISLSAQDDDFGTALFYLEEMLKHGYGNKDSLYNIEGTLGLKLTPEFNQLIEKYLGSSRYYDN